jgi:hypothetical protein
MVLSSVPRHSTTPAGGASLRMTASDLNTVHIRPATVQRKRGGLPKFRLEPLNGRIAPTAVVRSNGRALRKRTRPPDRLGYGLWPVTAHRSFAAGVLLWVAIAAARGDG